MQIISPTRQSVIWGVVLSLEKVQGLPLLLPLKNNTTVSQVDIQTVQERLQQNGVKVF